MLLLALNKPFNVVCQFRPHADDITLARFIDEPNVHPAGRLDKDSEGLLLLTDSGPLQHLITQPRHKQPKGYWVQVEGIPTEAELAKLRHGVMLKDGPTLPADVMRIKPPTVWERDPPIRERKSIPTSWLDITIYEGRNRQVRRMTAAMGFPTLRLIRYRIGSWYLNDLKPGESEQRTVPPALKQQLKEQAEK
ncbi:MAG: pseudouridine synthase [Gammaproteobacteria bacterium]|nr:pseudouridine synthase [Gammaproteobacteria bacterium]